MIKFISMLIPTGGYFKHQRYISFLLMICLIVFLVAAPNLPVCAASRAAVVHEASEKAKLNSDLFADSQSGNLKGVKKDLKEGASVNATEDNGWTPLMLATNWHHPQVVRYLLSRGANVDQHSTAYHDDWPLEIAASDGDYADAKLLLRYGANVNEKGIGTGTSLFNAIDGGAFPDRIYPVLKLLIDHGAWVNVVDNTGKSILSIAKSRVHFDYGMDRIVHLLEQTLKARPRKHDAFLTRRQIIAIAQKRWQREHRK